MIAPDKFSSEYDAKEPRIQAKLTDVGTRFDHINDLFDLWNDGIADVKHSLANFPNQSDVITLARLEAAVLLLSKYRDKLSKYDVGQWELQTEVDKIPKTGWKKGL